MNQFSIQSYYKCSLYKDENKTIGAYFRWPQKKSLLRIKSIEAIYILKTFWNNPQKFELKDDTELDDDALERNYIELMSTNQNRVYWRFPMTLVCPMTFCTQSFCNRKLIIDHYRTQHAAFAIFCEICGAPITRIPATVRTHFSILHQGEKCPWMSHVNNFEYSAATSNR